MGFRILATAVLVTHFAYLAYVVFGGFIAWRWPRTFWAYLAAATWGLIVIAGPLECPLTFAENWARGRAGESGLTTGFIDRYIEGVLYPARYTVLLQALAAATVFASWVGVYVRWRARARRNTSDTGKSEDSSDRATTV